MRCPQCKHVMKVVEEKAFSALLCELCGGMFYPEEEFTKHLDVVTRLLPQEKTQQELMPVRPPWGLSVGETHRPCPGCGGALRPFNYAYHSNIILANCPTCRGMWVEPGQMLRVARYRARHPGVDGIARKHTRARGPGGYDDSHLPRVNPLGCITFLFTFLPVPVSNAPALTRPPIITWLLIFMNVGLFLFVGRTYGLVHWAIVPADVTAGRDLQTYLTHQFAHADILHLGFNMIFLRAFADRVEDRLNPAVFLVTYLALGVVAALAHVYMDPESMVPCVGASGAISGVLGLYLALFTRSSIRLALPFITVPAPAMVFIGVYIGLQLAIPASSHIAAAAHLGGFFAGAWVGALVRILKLGERRTEE